MKSSYFYSFVFALFISMSGSAFSQNHQYVTILFDNTGSMHFKRANGQSRCEFGKELFASSLRTAIINGDYLDVKSFSSPGSLSSLSSGFIDVRGLNPFVGAGKVYYDRLVARVNGLTCGGGSTALGDALCDTIDELHAVNAGNKVARMGLITDAGENASLTCRGNNYALDHVLPRAFAQSPIVQFDSTILTTDGGSVRQARRALSADELTESPFEGSAERRAPGSATSARNLSEMAQLRALSDYTGGNFHVVEDDEACTSACDPFSKPADDPWGPIF